MSWQSGHIRCLGQFARSLAAVLVAVFGIFAAAPPPASPATYACDTAAYVYDASGRLSAPNTDSSDARGSPCMPLAMSWRSDTSVHDCGDAAKSVDSSAVRFSQSSVKGVFSDGRSVDELADGLRSGAVNPSDVPAIRLVERDGSFFSLDNRRLLAFQKAGMDVPYRVATPSEAASEAWKFSTTNGGTSIRIRGGGGVWP